MEKRISLYCTEGGADKVYVLWLESKGGLFTVEANWGRRGGSMQAGAKTPKPVSRADAEKVYEKTLAEKRAKGYHEGEDAPAFSQVKDAVDAGIRPMLLTRDVEESLDKYIVADAWAGQEKKNGKRILLRAGDEVVGINKRGLECPIPEELAKAVRGSNMLFDGELIGSEYHVFDLLGAGPGFAQDHRGEFLDVRWGEMYTAVRALKSDLVQAVPLLKGTTAKRKLVETLQAGRKEGVVFKLLHGLYIPGKVENLAKSAAVKIKFYAEGAFYVVGWTKGKSSVTIALVNPKTQERFPVGSLTIAQKWADQVKEGGTIRVRYLYATDADQLFQANLDPDDHGSVVSDGRPDAPGSLKHEGKDE